jgi:methylmalonyl-CoA/ethylmalonyl-CoA epimerase
MIVRIDHVGFATDDPAGLAGLMTDLGLGLTDEGTADEYGVACEFWCDPKGTALELVSPTREDSAIAGRLSSSGPGLYHLALEVDDLESEMDRLRGAGLLQVDRQPCQGARPGMRVAFLYAKRPAGLLVELVQYPATTRS